MRAEQNSGLVAAFLLPADNSGALHQIATLSANCGQSPRV
jgi:hypothetical protein